MNRPGFSASAFLGPALLSFTLLLCLGGTMVLPRTTAAQDIDWARGPSENPPLTFTVGDWAATLYGYVRTGFIWVGAEGDNAPDFIGQNNGFAMLDARTGVKINYLDKLELRLALDGAGDVRTNANDTVGSQRVELKDAYGEYRFADFFKVRVGQYKPPFDLEATESAADLTFVRPSVVSSGVRPGEGIQRPGNAGFTPSRQAGLSLLSDVIDFGPVGFTYHAAITNGNTVSSTRNDNNHLAYFGRLEFHLRNQLLGLYQPDSFLVFGGGLSYNQRTEGTLPNQLDEEDLSWQVDLQLKAYGVDALAQLLWNTREYPGAGEAKRDTIGILAQIAYRLPIPDYRFQVGYRFAYLDPFKDDTELAVDDLLIYHTIGVAYRLEALPVELKLNYTVTQEEGSAGVDNDLIEALVQVVW